MDLGPGSADTRAGSARPAERCSKGKVGKQVNRCAASLAAPMLLPVGCENEIGPVRTVRNVFDDLRGMQRGGGAGPTPVEQKQRGAEPAAELAAVVQTPVDGTVTLRAPMVRHALYHFRTRLISGEAELLTWHVAERAGEQRGAKAFRAAAGQHRRQGDALYRDLAGTGRSGLEGQDWKIVLVR